MSDKSAEDLAQHVTDGALHVAGRLASARQFGGLRTPQSLAALIQLASDEGLEAELSRELGRSAAKVAAAIGQTKAVSDTHLINFTESAFDGFDTETAIIQWFELSTGGLASPERPSVE